MPTKTMEYMRTIKGRPISLQERAPSYSNELLRIAAGEYKVGDIVPHLKYLISEVPISQRFWMQAGYDVLEFDYKGNKVTLFTNHGSEECMREVIRGKLDISYWILDLSKLLGTPIKDRTEREKFLEEVQERTKNGIEKHLIE